MYHLSYLAEAVRWERSEIFTPYLQWAQGMSQSRNVPVTDLAGYLTYLYAACMQVLPEEDFEEIIDYISDGKSKIETLNSPTESFLIKENVLFPFARIYLSLLLNGKRKKAQLHIQDLLKDGHSIPDIYENIFAPTQHEVGLLWQTNKITVAYEHYCTTATQQMMSALYMQIIHGAKRNYKKVGYSLSGGLHEIGIRSSCDILLIDDGEDALRYLNREDAFANESLRDLILLDVNLPKVDGKEVLLFLKNAEALKHINVVILTTSSLQSDVDFAYKNYANCYLVKSGNFTEFNRMMASLEHFWINSVNNANKN